MGKMTGFMKRKFMVGLTLMASSVLFGCSTARDSGKRVDVSEIKIKFASQQVAPPLGGLPKEAQYPKGADAEDHGALTNIVAGRMAALTVTWADPQIFKTHGQVQDFLRELLCSTNTQSWSFHIWSYLDGIPCATATVKHTNGRQGLWWVWDRPNLAWAYQDADGKWWWGSWDFRSPKPKSLGTRKAE